MKITGNHWNLKRFSNFFIISLINFLITMIRVADQYREIEYNAAVKIQAWYRKHRVRAYFKWNN